MIHTRIMLARNTKFQTVAAPLPQTVDGNRIQPVVNFSVPYDSLLYPRADVSMARHHMTSGCDTIMPLPPNPAASAICGPHKSSDSLLFFFLIMGITYYLKF